MSRDDVAVATIRALESQDASALVSLTLPQELERLNLTELTVRRFLSRTAWSTGKVRGLSIERIDQYPVDDVMFKVTCSYPASGLAFPFYFHVTQAPNGRWYLALGDMLRSTVYLVEGWKDRSSRHHAHVADVFRSLATETGIRGTRDNVHGYYLLSEPFNQMRTHPITTESSIGAAN